jgi:hypothetical protein
LYDPSPGVLARPDFTPLGGEMTPAVPRILADARHAFNLIALFNYEMSLMNAGTKRDHRENIG